MAAACVNWNQEELGQALKYRSVTDIVRLIRENERKPPDILSDLSETEVYCLSDPSVLVSNRTVALPDVNKNVAGGERNGEVDNGLECRHRLIIFFKFFTAVIGIKFILA
jgi:hypothetical protein